MVRYSTAGGFNRNTACLLAVLLGQWGKRHRARYLPTPTGKCRRGMRPAPNGIFGGPVGRKYSIGAMPSRWMDRAAVGLGRWQHSTRRIGLRGQRCGDLGIADAMFFWRLHAPVLCCMSGGHHGNATHRKAQIRHLRPTQVREGRPQHRKRSQYLMLRRHGVGNVAGSDTSFLAFTSHSDPS